MRFRKVERKGGRHTVRMWVVNLGFNDYVRLLLHQSVTMTSYDVLMCQSHYKKANRREAFRAVPGV